MWLLEEKKIVKLETRSVAVIKIIIIKLKLLVWHIERKKFMKLETHSVADRK